MNSNNLQTNSLRTKKSLIHFNMKRIWLFAISLFLSVRSFAIDPYGAKADFDYDSTPDRNLWFPLIILLLLGALFIYGYISSTLTEHRNKHKKQK